MITITALPSRIISIGAVRRERTQARGEYLSRLAAIVTADNPTRAMATVTLMRADGRIIMSESIGQFPDMTPKPEPEEEVNENG